MKHIKTFEQYANEFVGSELTNEEIFGLSKGAMQGKKEFIIDGKELKKLLEKHKQYFSMDGDKVKGIDKAMYVYKAIKNNFKMSDVQALEAALKWIDWNGFSGVDMKESKWDPQTLKLLLVKVESINQGKFGVV